MVTLRIGHGFNSAMGQVKPSSVFSTSIQPKVDNDISKLSYYSSVYKSLDDYKKNFSNSFKVGMPIPVPDTVNLDFALGIASNTQKDNSNLVYVIRITKIGKKEEFDEIAPVLSDPKVQHELKNSPTALANFYDKYGDSYVTSIYYGKEVAITIEFQNYNLETAKKINNQLNLGMNNAVKIENLLELDKVIKASDVRCKINVQSKGFKNNQLPPIMPNNITELTTWLTALQEKFDTFVANDYTDQLEYEVTTYSSILAGGELNVTELSMKALLISQYFSRIQKSKIAVDGYYRYYEYLGNNEPILTKLQLYKEKLDFIENVLRVNNDLTDPRVSAAVKSLRAIINDLNKLNDARIEFKVVNNITTADFGNNITDFNIFTRRHISQPFTIDVDSDLAVNRFSFSVTNPENKLSGRLGLYYSDSTKVPYDSRSQPIASNISIGNTTANVPDDLLVRGFKNTFLGYHYEGDTRRGFNINKPLQIETAISYKMPDDIYIDEPEDFESDVNAINKLKLTA